MATKGLAGPVLSMSALASFTGRLMASMKELMLAKWPLLRCSLSGFFIGVLPGDGATIASAMC
jgi:putative tricarboxylic transport membrane protein